MTTDANTTGLFDGIFDQKGTPSTERPDMDKDPLNNPRPVWRMHYDHRTVSGRWGRFLCRVLRCRTSADRYLDSLRKGT